MIKYPKEVIYEKLTKITWGYCNVLSAESIYEKVWGYSALNDKNAIQMTISRLRSKIEGTGYTITGYRSKGYAFEKA